MFPLGSYPAAVSVGSPRKLCFLVCCDWVFDLVEYKIQKISQHWTDLAENVDLLHKETKIRRFECGQKHTLGDFLNPIIAKYEAKGSKWIRNVEKERFAIILSELREEGYQDLTVEKQAFDRYGRPVKGSWAIYGKKVKK